MRLTALTLNRYGNFDNERMTFDARPGVLNLLLAPNGSGKSVLRAAFCDLLFGIGGQTPMGFRYGYPGMRITAEAITRTRSRSPSDAARGRAIRSSITKVSRSILQRSLVCWAAPTGQGSSAFLPSTPSGFAWASPTCWPPTANSVPPWYREPVAPTT